MKATAPHAGSTRSKIEVPLSSFFLRHLITSATDEAANPNANIAHALYISDDSLKYLLVQTINDVGRRNINHTPGEALGL